MGTTQITIRIPSDLVQFVDDAVTEGRGASRAAVISKELARAKRRAGAERDALIYAKYGEDPELAGLAEYQRTVKLDLD